MKVNMDTIKENRTLVAQIVFIALDAIIILLGVYALRTPVVAMCFLVILESAIAALLHHAELWVHGVLVLGELIAGIFTGKIVLILLCVVVYAAATALLQIEDRGESENGR